MVASKLAGIPAKVAAALAKVASTVTLYDPPTYDPTDQSTVEDASPLVITDASPPLDFSIHLIGVGNVQAGDALVIVRGDIAKTPSPNGSLLIGSTRWAIVGVKSVRLDATTVATYEIHVRR